MCTLRYLFYVLYQSVLRNGSLWADIFLTRDGASPDSRNPGFEPENICHVRKRESVARFFMIDTKPFPQC